MHIFTKSIFFFTNLLLFYLNSGIDSSNLRDPAQNNAEIAIFELLDKLFVDIKLGKLFVCASSLATDVTAGGGRLRKGSWGTPKTCVSQLLFFLQLCLQNRCDK